MGKPEDPEKTTHLSQVTGQAIKSVHLYFIPYYITILWSVFDSNKLTTYLFWSSTKTINFFRCLWLIDIKYVISISYDVFVLKVNVFNQQITPS